MALSLAFSVAIYFITTARLGRPIGSQQGPGLQQDQKEPSIPDNIQARIDERDDAMRQDTIISLVVLNIGMLAGGVGISYVLARRTLRPIEEVMELQMQFVSDASHELRTPLTALLTRNEVVLRKKHIDEPKAREVLEKNIEEIENLRTLSEELLGLVRADVDDKPPVATNLHDLTRGVIERLAPLSHAKHIKVHNNVSSKIQTVHPSAVQQILSIFLDNAIKYSPENSTVMIYDEGNSISVKDEGEGISKDDQARVFDRFYRADTARTRSGNSGHGLGLAIAKAVAERNGYEISFSSKQGSGSVFSLSLIS